MTSLQERIGYRFRDEKLLLLAMTHPSLNKPENNQRLEFLGDSILSAVVAHMLYDLYPQEQEGELARRLSALISGPTLAQAAREVGLGDEIQLGLSETQSRGRENPSNLEDAMEALIGAIYLDGGMAAAEQFIVPRWRALARQVEAPPKDAKTALQEWAQGRGLPVPTYTLLETTGPAHAPQFTVEVSVRGHLPVQSNAASKRVAEQQAATILLKALANG